jgi:hypothetical protein
MCWATLDAAGEPRVTSFGFEPVVQMLARIARDHVRGEGEASE